LKRIFKFSSGFLAVHLVTIAILSNIQIRDYSLLQLITHDNSMSGGGGGYTQLRFREAEHYGPVDILFVGSSRGIMAFDVDEFSRNGLRTFNLGSTGQCPLNSYFLLENFVDRLNPRLVVFESNCLTLESDGLESFFDLNRNMNMSEVLVKMAWAVENPHALTALASRLVWLPVQPMEKNKQCTFPGIKYIEGGFIKAEINNKKEFEDKARIIKINPRQLEYLDKSLKLLKERNISVLLTIVPETIEQKNSFSNYEEIINALDSLSKVRTTSFIDFSSNQGLNSRNHFCDFHHLNAAGAELFSRHLINYIYTTEELSTVLPERKLLLVQKPAYVNSDSLILIRTIHDPAM